MLNQAHIPQQLKMQVEKKETKKTVQLEGPCQNLKHKINVDKSHFLYHFLNYTRNQQYNNVLYFLCLKYMQKLRSNNRRKYTQPNKVHNFPTILFTSEFEVGLFIYRQVCSFKIRYSKILILNACTIVQFIGKYLSCYKYHYRISTYFKFRNDVGKYVYYRFFFVSYESVVES